MMFNIKENAAPNYCLYMCPTGMNKCDSEFSPIIIRKPDIVYYLTHIFCIKGEVSPNSNVDWVSRKQF